MMIKPKQIKAEYKHYTKTYRINSKNLDLMENQIKNQRKSNPNFVNDWK